MASNDTRSVGKRRKPSLRRGDGTDMAAAPAAPDRAPDGQRGAERTCILTREAGGRDALIRLALSPDGAVLPDIRARAPGRGAWIGVDRQALDAAIAKGRLRGALMRAFRTQTVTVPADLGDRIADGLARNALDRMGLEARAGTLVTGGERIGDQARAGKVHALYHAADAGADGRRKLDQAWRIGRDEEGSGRQGLVIPASRTTLSLALGRENVVSVAMIDRHAAARVDRALGRWCRFIGPDFGDGPCDSVAGAMPVTGKLTEGSGD